MRRIDYLKEQAEQRGLVPYAGLYGDRRKLATWQKLLESENLEPLLPRQTKTSSIQQDGYRDDGFEKAVFLLTAGAVACLLMMLCVFLKPIADKVLPVRITIQIGAK